MKTRTNLMMTAALAAAMVIPAMAGNIWLEFGNAAASKDPAAKGALTVVRATGCHEPDKALFSANAEGKVDGKRKTIPLEIVKLSAPGTYAVKGAVPKEGIWVISVASTLEGDYLASAILPVGVNGVEKPRATLHQPVSDKQIAAALQP